MQFPKDPSDESIQFSLQNCLEPFPLEHHGRYDLVHVRLLVAALKESEYKTAVANIATLLSMSPSFAMSFLHFILIAWLQSLEAISNGKTLSTNTCSHTPKSNTKPFPAWTRYASASKVRLTMAQAATHPKVL